MTDSGSSPVERKGVEPSTSALRTHTPTAVNENGQQLTTPPISVCTSVCTGEPETANGPPAVAPIDPALATLAAALLNLDPAARAALAAMLLKANR